MGTKRPKLTKKMLSHLDKAEIRTIIMGGMNVKPETAYQADTRWCVDHIYQNQLEFAEADLSDIPVKKFRHPGVYTYVRGLQGYLLGSAEAPAWPPTPQEMDTATQTNLVPGVPSKPTEVDAEPVKSEPKMKLVQPEKVEAKVPVKEDDLDVNEEPLTLTERGKAMQGPNNIGNVGKKVSFRKVDGFGNNGEEVEEVSSTLSKDSLNEVLEPLFVALRNHQEVDTSKIISRQTELYSRVESIENALLFILNSAILKEDELIESLEQVPTPPY